MHVTEMPHESPVLVAPAKSSVLDVDTAPWVATKVVEHDEEKDGENEKNDTEDIRDSVRSTRRRQVLFRRRRHATTPPPVPSKGSACIHEKQSCQQIKSRQNLWLKKVLSVRRTGRIWQINQRMNEPIFALLLFASLSLLDSFFPSGLLLTKISLSTTLHVPFHSILALKFKGTGMILIHSSRNRHLKKITPNGNASYVFLKSLSDCHCQSTQRRISCNTFFFPKYTFGAPIGAQQRRFEVFVQLSPLSLYRYFL